MNVLWNKKDIMEQKARQRIGNMWMDLLSAHDQNKSIQVLLQVRLFYRVETGTCIIIGFVKKERQTGEQELVVTSVRSCCKQL